MTNLKPERIYKLFDGGVELHLFGKEFDWSLRGLNNQEDLHHKKYADVYNRIKRYLYPMGLTKISAPAPHKFNALFCETVDLNVQIKAKNSDFLIMRGVEADACEVLNDQPLIISSADCPTLIAYSPATKRCIASHAGRDCLFDRLKAVSRNESRAHDSVVHTIIKKLSSYNEEISQVKFFITCGILAPDFLHQSTNDIKGDSNKKIVKYLKKKWPSSVVDLDSGAISIVELISAQLQDCGAKKYNIGFDSINTHSDKNRSGDFIWWSHRRDCCDERNGVFIIKR